ncbi:hypothetical protein NC796_24375 [Aliifodinibius sp. S!AR15-10]|uniref:hypothetical protein n=1 Tax=Aliifodinibius sp. S!AR15-10 TaxID=2950437 RepID=UPI00285FA752|nr:hypothetical protein [Aliifodinibius sp. S!AR15-10]MDR8394307.1 hypothetical protein [Aliifodinibius sp. S!AR15-10]
MAIPKEDPSNIKVNSRTRVFLGLALLMTLIAVGGFWHTYWWPMLTGEVNFHWLIHIHGAIFTLWMVLFIAQTAFVYKNRTDLHIWVGKRIGILWGALVILVGLVLSFGVISPAIGTEFETLADFINFFPIAFGDVITFSFLFGLGIFYRSKPETHKRLMILSTVVLLFAPAERLMRFIPGLPAQITFALGLPFVPALLAIGHDRWRTNRIHPVYIWGTTLIALETVSTLYFFASPGWESLSEMLANKLRTLLLPLL